MRVWQKLGQFLNLFSFPSNFLWLFTFSLIWNSSKHSVSFFTNSIVAFVHLQIFRKKVWALILSPHILYFELHFHEYLCWCFDCCYGFISMFLGLFLFGLLKVLFPCKLVSVDGFIYFLVFVFLEIIWLLDLWLMYYHMLVSFTHSAWT